MIASPSTTATETDKLEELKQTLWHNMKWMTVSAIGLMISAFVGTHGTTWHDTSTLIIALAGITWWSKVLVTCAGNIVVALVTYYPPANHE